MNKILVVLYRLGQLYFNVFGYTTGLLNPKVKIGRGCTFGRGVQLRATDGGQILIGNNVNLADSVRIIVQGGCVNICDDVFVGFGTNIVCRESICVGRGTLIAEYVVIRDQDHRINSYPVRKSGFVSSPIIIGQNVWIGAKASILRGAAVGDACVVGAHALVKSVIPNNMLAVGVPAHPIRTIRRLD